MKELMKAGSNTIDITEDHLADTLDLTHFDELTRKLGMDKSEQVYCIYLWLKYAIELTVNRKPAGGNAEVGVGAQMAT